MLLNYFYNIKDIFEKDLDNTNENKCSSGSTPTLKDLPPALSSTFTYILANAQPSPKRRVWKNLHPPPGWGVETMKSR